MTIENEEIGEKIIQIIRLYPGLNIAEIAEKLKLRRITVARHVVELENNKKIIGYHIGFSLFGSPTVWKIRD